MTAQKTNVYSEVRNERILARENQPWLEGAALAWLIKRKDVRSGWYVGFRGPDGREIRRAAGKSRRSAERIRAKIETEVREGKFFERDQRSAWTLGRLSEVYLERMARLKPRSSRWRHEMFRQLLRVLGPGALIEEINMGTLDRYGNRRRSEGKAYSTINREISILRHAMRLAARWKTETMLTQYRLADWTLFREAETARKAVFLTREQVDAFRSPELVELDGQMLSGATNHVSVLVASIEDFLVMKAHALAGRDKPKDAYDICYCLDNAPGGVEAIARAWNDWREDDLIVAAIGHLSLKFETVKSYGPMQVAAFYDDGEPEVREMRARRAFELVSQFLERVRS